MDSIRDAIFLCLDILGFEHESCIKIDFADNDDEIREGLKECVEAIEKLGKPAIAKQVKELTTGFIVW